MLTFERKLFKLDSKNRIRVWSVKVKRENESSPFFNYTVLSGLLDGKLKKQVTVIKEGKNLGKANETSPNEQAVLEATSNFNKKLDQGYKEVNVDETDSNYKDKLYAALVKLGKTDAAGRIKPMLAKPYKMTNTLRREMRAGNVYAQLKYDGIRCLTRITNDGKIEFYTRGGKEHAKRIPALEQLTTELFQNMLIKTELNNKKVYNLDGNYIKPGDTFFDGELYSHDLTFQQITAAVKAPHKHPIWVSRIFYKIYDMPLEDMPQSLRLKKMMRLRQMPTNSNKRYEFVTSTLVHDEDNLNAIHTDAVSRGYEGLILRIADGEYQPNKRSSSLIKVKLFDEDEFEIVNVYEAEKEPGCAMFSCVTDKGLQFETRPMGSQAIRNQYLQDKNNIIGKQATVKYFGYTDEGLPRHAHAKTVRDYE